MAGGVSDFLTIQPDLLLTQRFEHHQQAEKLGAPRLDRLDDFRPRDSGRRTVLLGEGIAQHPGIHGQHGGSDQNGGSDSVHATGIPWNGGGFMVNAL